MLAAGRARWAWALVPALISLANPARAHEVGLSRGDYAAEGLVVRSDLTFASKELIRLVAGLDADHDGALTQGELDAGRDAMQGAVAGRVKVSGDGAACSAKLGRAEITEQDGALLRVDHHCAAPPREVQVRLGLLADLPGHRHLVRAFAAAGPLDLVIAERSPSFSFTPPAPPRAPITPAFGSVKRGALHAIGAFPLPLFLVGLLARAPSLRGVILAGALFTLALLFGLFAAAGGLFVPSARMAGVAVALSLAYVGVDIFAERPSGAWMALPFGAAHGLAAGLVAGGAPGPFAIGAAGVTLIFAALIAAALSFANERGVLTARRRTALGAMLVLAGLGALFVPYLMPS